MYLSFYFHFALDWYMFISINATCLYKPYSWVCILYSNPAEYFSNVNCCSEFLKMSKNNPVKMSTWRALVCITPAQGFSLSLSLPLSLSLSLSPSLSLSLSLSLPLYANKTLFCVRGSRRFETFRCFCKRITAWPAEPGMVFTGSK